MVGCTDSKNEIHSRGIVYLVNLSMWIWKKLFLNYRNCGKISEYSINDVFNADKSGLFYKLAPDSSIGPSRISGKKKKKRLSLLACVNGDGTEKLPLEFIGKSKKLKCFDGNTVNELGFNYHFTSKSWMNTAIFLSSLNHFIYILEKAEIEKHFYLSTLYYATAHRKRFRVFLVLN